MELCVCKFSLGSIICNGLETYIHRVKWSKAIKNRELMIDNKYYHTYSTNFNILFWVLDIINVVY